MEKTFKKTFDKLFQNSFEPVVGALDAKLLEHRHKSAVAQKTPSDEELTEISSRNNSNISRAREVQTKPISKISQILHDPQARHPAYTGPSMSDRRSTSSFRHPTIKYDPIDDPIDYSPIARSTRRSIPVIHARQTDYGRIAQPSRSKDPEAFPELSILGTPIIDKPTSDDGRPQRTTRSTRKSTTQSSPLPSERYSIVYGLGDPWKYPVAYPPTGKGKATVYFEDLIRLDEGEFLNDNLIEFAMRWTEQQYPQYRSKVYCFNTHFYSTLSSGKGRGLNYDAVKKWTKDVDIFSYDYIVVPVNENLHWYLALICHPSSVFQPKDLVILDDDEDTSELIEDRDVVESQDNVAKIGLGAQARQLLDSFKQTKEVDKQVIMEPPVTAIGKSPSPSGKLELLSLDDGGTEVADGVADKSRQEVSGLTTYLKDAATGAISSLAQRLKDLDNNKTNPNTGTSRRGKRKLPPRKYKPGESMIIILDSMGNAHGPTTKNLKLYLVKEAEEKGKASIDEKRFKGANAKAGIPRQDNFSDCGVFVCGYIEKLLSDPDTFGHKLLQQEFDVKEDWPDMNPAKMRNTMRQRLQTIAKEQSLERKKIKSEKKAGKSLNQPLVAPISAVVEGDSMDGTAKSQPSPDAILLATAPSIPQPKEPEHLVNSEPSEEDVKAPNNETKNSPGKNSPAVIIQDPEPPQNRKRKPSIESIIDEHHKKAYSRVVEIKANDDNDSVNLLSMDAEPVTPRPHSASSTLLLHEQYSPGGGRLQTSPHVYDRASTRENPQVIEDSQNHIDLTRQEDIFTPSSLKGSKTSSGQARKTINSISLEKTPYFTTPKTPRHSRGHSSFQ